MMTDEIEREDPTAPFALKAFKTALLIGVYRSTAEKQSCEDNLNELERLCDTYGLQAVDRVLCPIKKLDAGNYLGSGKSR